MELFKTKKILIKTLKETINILQEEITELKEKNKIYEHNIIILLENEKENREEQQNLLRNIEFITNNLSAQKKKKIGLK